ncbi:unnamed protein product [marine sediment metagenome]|uniref:Uncharacterized protein n=1 Tax=marine sediment metagenome TaxID=412755 RepID=X1BYI5_9ZZZZ
MSNIKNKLEEEEMYSNMESDDYANELEYYRHQVEDGKISIYRPQKRSVKELFTLNGQSIPENTSVS